MHPRQLPFFLIGAVLAAGTPHEGALSTAELAKNPKLEHLVKELKKLIHKGGEQRLLQRRPHWVLLSIPFYEQELFVVFLELTILWRVLSSPLPCMSRCMSISSRLHLSITSCSSRYVTAGIPH